MPSDQMVSNSSYIYIAIKNYQILSYLKTRQINKSKKL